MSFQYAISHALYLDGAQAWLRQRSGPPWRPSWSDSARLPIANLSDLAAHLRGKNPRLKVWLGGVHCRWTVFSRPAGIIHNAPLQAIAEKQFKDNLGLDTKHWRIALHSRPDGVIAAAAPLALLTSIQKLGEAHNVKLEALRPWMAHLAGTVPQHTKRQHALALIEADAVTLMNTRPGSLAITSLPTTNSANDTLLARFALQHRLDTSIPTLRLKERRIGKLRGDFYDLLELAPLTP